MDSNGYLVRSSQALMDKLAMTEGFVPAAYCSVYSVLGANEKGFSIFTLGDACSKLENLGAHTLEFDVEIIRGLYDAATNHIEAVAERHGVTVEEICKRLAKNMNLSK